MEGFYDVPRRESFRLAAFKVEKKVKLKPNGTAPSTATYILLGSIAVSLTGGWFTLKADVEGKAEASDVALIAQQMENIAEDVADNKKTVESIEKEQIVQGKTLAAIANELGVD